MAVGAPGLNGQAGAVHVIQMEGNPGEHWAASLCPDGLSSRARFGSSLAAWAGDGGREMLAIGAPGQPGLGQGQGQGQGKGQGQAVGQSCPSTGAVYLYRGRSVDPSAAEEEDGGGDGCEQEDLGLAAVATPPAEDEGGWRGRFGACVALGTGQGQLLVVGCPLGPVAPELVPWLASASQAAANTAQAAASPATSSSAAPQAASPVAEDGRDSSGLRSCRTGRVFVYPVELLD